LNLILLFSDDTGLTIVQRRVKGDKNSQDISDYWYE